MSEKLETLEENQETLNAFWKIRALLIARSNNNGSRELAKNWKISPRHARRYLRQADVYFEILLPLILKQPELEVTGSDEKHTFFRVQKDVLAQALVSMEITNRRLLAEADGRT